MLTGRLGSGSRPVSVAPGAAANRPGSELADPGELWRGLAGPAPAGSGPAKAEPGARAAAGVPAAARVWAAAAAAREEARAGAWAAALVPAAACAGTDRAATAMSAAGSATMRRVSGASNGTNPVLMGGPRGELLALSSVARGAPDQVGKMEESLCRPRLGRCASGCQGA